MMWVLLVIVVIIPGFRDTAIVWSEDSHEPIVSEVTEAIGPFSQASVDIRFEDHSLEEELDFIKFNFFFFYQGSGGDANIFGAHLMDLAVVFLHPSFDQFFSLGIRNSLSIGSIGDDKGINHNISPWLAILEARRASAEA